MSAARSGARDFGIREERLRRTFLSYPPFLQPDHFIRQTEDLRQMVAYEHGCKFEVMPDPFDVILQTVAHIVVQRGQWFVQQQQPGSPDDGPGQRHPLLLSS